MKNILLKKGSYYISEDMSEIIHVLGETSTTYEVDKYEESKITNNAEGRRAYLYKDFVDMDRNLEKKRYRELSEEEFKHSMMLWLL